MHECHWTVIISSPYIRCVQTAAEMARILQLPIILDTEFGEVYDDVYMPKANNQQQFRSAQEIATIMDTEYPDVTVVSGSDGWPKHFGQQPDWPEPFAAAQVRFLE